MGLQWMWRGVFQRGREERHFRELGLLKKTLFLRQANFFALLIIVANEVVVFVSDWRWSERSLRGATRDGFARLRRTLREEKWRKFSSTPG